MRLSRPSLDGSFHGNTDGEHLHLMVKAVPTRGQEVGWIVQNRLRSMVSPSVVQSHKSIMCNDRLPNDPTIAKGGSITFTGIRARFQMAVERKEQSLVLGQQLLPQDGAHRAQD